MEDIVKQVEQWFEQHKDGLSVTFPLVRLHLAETNERRLVSATIQLNGPLAGAQITFWNRGEVSALGLDKVHRRDYTIDDRRLNAQDDVSTLLSSYTDHLIGLVKELQGASEISNRTEG
jgi:hypothetical protein